MATPVPKLVGAEWMTRGDEDMERQSIAPRLIFFVMAIALSAYPPYAAAEQKMGQAPSDLMKGKKIFVRYCSGCHGPAGQGDGYRILGPAPADLTALESKQRSDATLLKTIHDGKPNMPVWKYKLSKQQTRDVLAYIRSLQERP